MKKINPLKSLTLLITLFCAVKFGFGQEIASFSSVQNSGCSGVVYNDINMTASGICRGPGIVETTSGSPINYNSRDWTTASTLDTNDYLEWTLTPNSGYQISFTTMDIQYDRSPSDGPTMLDIHIDTGSGFSSIFSDSSVSPSGENNTIDLSTITGITNIITFRLYAFSATSASGTLHIEQHTATDKGVVINGAVSVVPTCGSSVTWDGSFWSAPADITTEVTLLSSYNTATDGGSFSACNLIVNNGATLNIADNDYVEVDNGLTVNSGGFINVQPTGAFIQNNDSGLITNNGTITVSKDTAPLNNWYEYTYWSSPVSDATVGVALSDSDAGRRFSFNASQFNDELMETGNNNTFVAGQDDIDDEGNDWQWVSGTTVMQPGVGYAATHSELAFVFPGVPYRYTFQAFSGEKFNNGVINVTVDRNDATTVDFNWNFIGNPFPSAIEIDAFMTQNMYPAGPLEGAIYFWSQNTNYSATENGNEAYNFNTSDYATHNGTAGTAGGDGLIPNDFIPSGQGFFVSFSDSAPSNTGTVVFNNAMRSLSLSPDNSQFFKNSSSKRKSINNNNKLWLNLTSDNGVFNQIAIGYVNGATNNDDGAYYDARKIVAPNTFAALYSIIENSDKKYVIQGKDINSINEDELINLGFSTTIDVETIYSLSIAQIEGNFLSNNPIYIKDNLLNQLHDLTTSDYTFTSEVGEFNDRFEIVFNSAALSTTDVALNSKSLRIIELEDDSVQFTASDNLSIKTVTIFDLLGRPLYSFKGNNASETYTLSNLHSSIYIAKVALSNGVVVTKKAIKK